MAIEIERKYLLEAYPDELIQEGTIVVEKELFIEQTYLALDGDQELRVRKITDLKTGQLEFTHTFKKGWGIAREEVEYAISEGLYDQVVKAHGAIPLTKKRVTGRWGSTIIEIDDYAQISLLVLEVEFPSMEAADGFVPPAWFGQDISTDKQYSNKKVWRDLQLQAGREA
ncbi:CYTH domain-containing protein [Paenibacillus lautus]|uniref:CYTH domain-containing protein n=1 Tax=Paenibacillus lautus TaxID=1401 RepID=UPI002DBA3B4F|nr:CYTH domain-containing protein [Paenibacillus lautus]MEC0203861.1 CYTH domain-containing protein [Paenibacillus lautus]